MPLIEVLNLEKTYHADSLETPVLKGVSFAIEKGEFVAIMGPSGSGKSTLVHILGFLDKATGGEYRFEEKRADEYSEQNLARLRNKKMGFVFQAFHLLPRISVLENVMLPLLYSDMPTREWQQSARLSIESVGLSHRILYEPPKLSGGEKQRVAIARALVNNPEVIFADEPTGNLDSKSGNAVMDILDSLNREKGHTVILITHESDIARRAKRIIRMQDGRIVEDKLR